MEEIKANAKDAELAALRLEKIGFVFQTFNLLATMSVRREKQLARWYSQRMQARRDLAQITQGARIRHNRI